LLKEDTFFIVLLLIFVQASLVFFAQLLLFDTSLLPVVLPLVGHLLDVPLECDFEPGELLLGLLLHLMNGLLQLLDLRFVLARKLDN